MRRLSIAIALLFALVAVPCLAEAQRISITNTLNPELDHIAPIVTILVPTSESSYDAGEVSSLLVSGTSTDDTGTRECLWQTNQGGLGAAQTASNGDWLIPSVPLIAGTTTLTVTCLDPMGNPGVDVLPIQAGPPLAVDDPDALWVEASGGATTGTCPSSNPCTFARARSIVTDGGTIIVTPGTYAGFAFSTPENVTFTAPASVKNALLWTCDNPWIRDTVGQANCGIVVGTDTRPLMSSDTQITANGTTLDHLRIRGGASPVNVLEFNALLLYGENVTLRYSEVSNGGQCVTISKRRSITLQYNHIHHCGSAPSELDTHAINITAGGVPGSLATSFDHAVRLLNNTIHDAGGDAVQENSQAYGCGDGEGGSGCQFNYLIIEYNDMYALEEQGFDWKGTNYVIGHGNSIASANYGAISFTYDPPTRTMANHWYWGNRFVDIPQYVIARSQSAPCSNVKFWSNEVLRALTAPEFNYPAVEMCGDAGSFVVFNTFVDNTNGSAAPRSYAIKDNGSGNNIRNNTCYRNGTGSDDRRCIGNVSGEDSGTPDHNYILPNDTNGGLAKTGINVVTTCFEADNCPGFTDLEADDLRPQVGSPLIDAGAAIGSHVSLTDDGLFTPSIDAAGYTRDSTPDIGALEAQD